MEQTLDAYTADYDIGFDGRHVLLCMDEASKQLLASCEPQIPLCPGQPVREDYHYERNGTAAIFCFFEPLAGWRRVSVRESRMRHDWAEEVARLLEEDYPEAKTVTLVCDNLNTHDIASLYHTFEAERAHRLARRLRLVHTPRSGSWLNVTEVELSVLSRQCLDRRIGSIGELRSEVSAWERDRNADASTVRWRLTSEQARVRLAHLYPRPLNPTL